MIVGDPQRFAIEVQAEDRPTAGWLLGRLRFWLGGAPVGNWDDAVDLRASVRWLCDFAEKARDRFEPAVADLSKAEVVRILFDEYMSSTDVPKRAPDIGDIFERFHISHLGMSAFDAVDLLLLFRADGSERCIWRDSRSGVIGEVQLAPREMETVAAELCGRFRELEASRTST